MTAQTEPKKGLPRSVTMMVLRRYCELREGEPAITSFAAAPSEGWRGEPSELIWVCSIAAMIQRSPERMALTKWCSLWTADRHFRPKVLDQRRRGIELEAIVDDLQRVCGELSKHEREPQFDRGILWLGVELRRAYLADPGFLPAFEKLRAS